VRVSTHPALAAFVTSPDLVVLVDREHRIVARNPAAAGFELDATGRDAAARALASRHAQGFEWDQVSPGGLRVWFAAHAWPLEIEGNPVGVIVSSRDVTALKRSEERFRRSEQLMVDAQGVAHMGTWEWEVSQPIAMWSAELYRIYGLRPEDYTPSYEAYLAKVHPEDRQRVIDATNRVFHDRVPYSHDERVLRPDGSIRYLHTWAYPALDDHGELVRLAGVCLDVTDRAASEHQLQLLNTELARRVSERTKQAQLALHDLEAFNAMVSHDLRAPLAVIQMGTEVLQEQRELAERAPPVLARIQRAVDTMSHLLDDLLVFARVGEAALHPVEIDVTALSSELIVEQRLASPARSVEVFIDHEL
jgi:PAS domain S-box-containing protein